MNASVALAFLAAAIAVVGAWDALARMMEQDAQPLLVVRDGRLKGIVSREAIFRRVQFR